MTNFGTPRNTSTKIKAENLAVSLSSFPWTTLNYISFQVITFLWTLIKAEETNFSSFFTLYLQEIPEEILLRSHGEVRLQSGTNKYDSQRGMTGFGTGRDVCREGKHVSQNPSDLPVYQFFCENLYLSIFSKLITKHANQLSDIRNDIVI